MKGEVFPEGLPVELRPFCRASRRAVDVLRPLFVGSLARMGVLVTERGTFSFATDLRDKGFRVLAVVANEGATAMLFERATFLRVLDHCFAGSEDLRRQIAESDAEHPGGLPVVGAPSVGGTWIEWGVCEGSTSKGGAS